MDIDVGAKGVHDVNGVSRFELPWSSLEGVLQVVEGVAEDAKGSDNDADGLDDDAVADAEAAQAQTEEYEKAAHSSANKFTEEQE